MRYLIFKYLNRHYYVCNNTVYKKSGDLAVTRSRGTLCYELRNIFNLTNRKLKWFIKKWCYKHSPYFDFKDFWETKYVFGSFTGTSYMDAGMIYAPYLPTISIGTAVASGFNNIIGCDPAVLDHPSIITAGQHTYTSYTASTYGTGMTSRYGAQVVNPSNYEIIQIGGQ